MCTSVPSGRRVYLFFLGAPSKMYNPGTIANSQTDRTATKINKNGAVAKVRTLVELGIL